MTMPPCEMPDEVVRLEIQVSTLTRANLRLGAELGDAEARLEQAVKSLELIAASVSGALAWERPE